MIVLFLCNNLENNLIPNLKLNIIMIENYFIFYNDYFIFIIFYFSECYQ